MKQTTIPITFGDRPSKYEVTLASGAVEKAGLQLVKSVGSPATKVLIVSNRKVFGLYGGLVSESLLNAGYDTSVHLIGDGERFKSFRTLENALLVLARHRFSRTDAVVALGGGVVGDLAGFAASIYLRGIPLLQIPTTLLSMIDSSVGGKTGINNEVGKNLIGTFYQPVSVLIDVDVLKTLPRRELTAGFCEAIKQGALSGKPLLSQVASFLDKYPSARIQRHFGETAFLEDLIRLIANQITFKASIVQNDETESVRNDSPKSRKILNFGHTLAHALEKVTNYKHLRHGEAVGYGIRFAAELSKKLELIEQHEVDLLNDVVHRAGGLPGISHIDPSELIEAFKADKKRVGSSLHWVLLRGMGKPLIVPDHEIPRSAIKSTLRSIIKG